MTYRLVELGYASWFGFEIFPPGRFVVRRFRLLLEQAKFCIDIKKNLI